MFHMRYSVRKEALVARHVCSSSFFVIRGGFPAVVFPKSGKPHRIQSQLFACTISAKKSYTNCFVLEVSLFRIEIRDRLEQHILQFNSTIQEILRYYLTSQHITVGRVAQSVQRLPTGWTVRGSNPGGSEIFHRPALRPTQPPVQWVPGLSRG